MSRTFKGLALAAAAVFVLVLAVSALQTQAQDTAKDPVCGMSVKIATAKYTSDYKGTKYYFCSEGCKTSFDKEPEKYLAKTNAPAAGDMGGGMTMHNHEAQTPDTATDPICGMSVKISTAKYSSEYKGAKYYFCSEGCKTTFDKDPEKYAPAKCAVCGMDVKKDGAQFTTEYKGVKYYFRCANCKAKFDKDPEKYLDKKYVPKPDEQKPDGASCSCAACATKK
jgi:YHS domain-containing protein